MANYLINPPFCSDNFIRSYKIIRSKYEVSTLKIVQDSTNTRDLDKKSVGMPGTQPAFVGRYLIFG